MIESFSSRWKNVVAGGLRDHLLKSQCTSPFGTTDEDLCDYRGIEIVESLHKVSISSVDFSEAIMSSGQLSADVSHSKFRSCRFETNLGSGFLECDFTNANLANSVFRGKFSSCDFTSANLTNVRGVEVVFDRCTFEGSIFRKASLVNCVFVACKFARCKFGSGSLAGSKFTDCVIEDVDFSKTVMQRVTGLA